jgi:hypothetical protein
MTSPLPQVVIYKTNSVDGIDEVFWCVDNQIHVEVIEGQVRLLGPCDGSCHPEQRHETIDLVNMITAWRAETCLDGDQTLHSQVTLNKGVQELLDSNRPIQGAEFYRYYCKRSSGGSDYCLGDQHLVVRTDFSRWADPRAEHFQEHSIELDPCDGSCRREWPLDPEFDSEIINQLRRLLSAM